MFSSLKKLMKWPRKQDDGRESKQELFKDARSQMRNEIDKLASLIEQDQEVWHIGQNKAAKDDNGGNKAHWAWWESDDFLMPFFCIILPILLLIIGIALFVWLLVYLDI